MSFVTCCTSCGTLFKVVADQLKISDGWVRCGQCATVFDAQAHLVDAPPVAATPAPISPASGASPAAASHAIGSTSFGADSISGGSSFHPSGKDALQAAFEPYRTSPSTFGTLQADSASEADAPNKPESERPVAKPQHVQPESLKFETTIPDPQSFRLDSLHGSDELEGDEVPSKSNWASSEHDQRQAEDLAVSYSAEPTTMHSPSSFDVSSLPEPDLAALSSTPQLPTPSFVKQAQSAQRWRSPWMRLGLGLMGLLLLASLVAQIALQDKDRIAAQWPQTKPWLDQFCEHAGCQVQAYRRIEAIAVDASSFNRINKNNAQLEAVTQSYRLSVTLKNTGVLPVELPHVELSLQDAQDQSILRRVLSPADFGAVLPTLAPAQDMAGSLTLQIDTAQLSGSRIQGYRVLAFYP